MLHQLFMSFLTLGKQDDRNLKAVADMLKVSGEALESDEKELSGGSCENMDHLMAAVQSISTEDRVSEETKSLYPRLVQRRSRADRGGAEFHGRANGRHGVGGRTRG